MLLLNVPSNKLGIGAIDIAAYADTNLPAQGTLSPEQWAALLAIIGPFLPPPVGTKGVTTPAPTAPQP